MTTKRLGIPALLAIMLCCLAQDALAFYNSQTGRWLSRDPAKEGGGRNIYCSMGNNLISQVDALGLWATKVHHDIVEDWLSLQLTGIDYHHYQWRCCVVDVIKAIEHGSDKVDGVGWLYWPHWCDAQSSRSSYQHAMRNGATDQPVEDAKQQFAVFMLSNRKLGMIKSDWARSSGSCRQLRSALRSLGEAYHAFSDSLSPAHGGFQPWWGPIDGVEAMGFAGYLQFVENHEKQESEAVYRGMQTSVIGAVGTTFDSDLSYILSQ